MENKVKMPSKAEIDDLFEKLDRYRNTMYGSARTIKTMAESVHSNRSKMLTQMKGVAEYVHGYLSVYRKQYTERVLAKHN